MNVEVKNFRKQNRADRNGFAIEFHIANPQPNTIIYQNVSVSLKTINGSKEKDKLKYEFTEAWKYSPSRKITDSFLVPVDWRMDQKGYMRVKTKIWAVSGPMDSGLKKGTGSDYWGNLHGSFDVLTPPEENVTTRRVKFVWDNIGKTAKKHFAKGVDLEVTRNKVDSS